MHPNAIVLCPVNFRNTNGRYKRTKMVYRNPLGEEFTDLNEECHYYSIMGESLYPECVPVKKINPNKYGSDINCTYICKNKASALVALSQYYEKYGYPEDNI